MFHHAIVRPPGENFAQGLTTANLGSPDHKKALEQHAAYCQALIRWGLELTTLKPDLHYPDSTFVEDAAVLAGPLAVITNPGAPSRKGETEEICSVLKPSFTRTHTINPPGTLEGGDICEAEGHFFIGISERTNIEGGRQLAGFLAREGFTSTFVDINGVGGILHLKSGIAYLGKNNLVLIDALAERPEFEGYNIIRVSSEENYAANCVRVNEHVLVADGFPRFRDTIESLGYPVIALDMSEYEKMDGGLSCLSLRF